MVISIHTFLAEGDDTTRDRIQMLEPFQSTPSSRKVTGGCIYGYILLWISIHTFLAEGDRVYSRGYSGKCDFNPHLPRGRWPQNKRVGNWNWYFNPHLPRGRWRYTTLRIARGWRISIHTFLAEGDADAYRVKVRTEHISIHTFLAEGDIMPSRSQHGRTISIHTFLAEGDRD